MCGTLVPMWRTMWLHTLIEVTPAFELMHAIIVTFLTCRPNRESLLFAIQSIFSFYCNINDFCDINIISFWRNICGTLNFPKYFNDIMCITTCSGSSHGLWTWFAYSMRQIPSWEASSFSASQEIPCILWNPKIRYRICKCLPAQSSP